MWHKWQRCCLIKRAKNLSLNFLFQVSLRFILCLQVSRIQTTPDILQLQSESRTAKSIKLHHSLRKLWNCWRSHFVKESQKKCLHPPPDLELHQHVTGSFLSHILPASFLELCLVVFVYSCLQTNKSSNKHTDRSEITTSLVELTNAHY